MVSPKTAFWDASSLIPLCVQGPGTQRVRELFRQFPPIVWWATTVEVHSAIARLHRYGQLNARDHQVALHQLSVLKKRWRAVAPEMHLRDTAEALLDAHPLRAADALQLAAALSWCQQKPSRRRFLSGDLRLCEAAASVGFTVVQTN